MTTFEKLNNINLQDKTKEKIGLKYLSWAYAWGELKKASPNASYTIYTRTVETSEVSKTNFDGVERTVTNTYSNEVPYFTDGRTCFVKVGVTVDDVEYIEYLPVMDNKNNAIRLEQVTSTSVNKAVQRAFVKACARHGLGLYIYAGEDLPEVEKKVINYDDIKASAEQNVNAMISSDDFNKFKAETIELVKKYQNNQDVGQAIFDYTTALFPGKRLSNISYDEDKLNVQKLNNFLKAIDSEFAK